MGCDRKYEICDLVNTVFEKNKHHGDTFEDLHEDLRIGVTNRMKWVVSMGQSPKS